MAKRKSGKRTASGRLSRANADPRKAWDYGNEIVQARRLLFTHETIQGGKAADQVSDAIGRLWALGMLNNHGFDGKMLCDKGRDYANAWWAYWGGRLSATDNEPRTSSSQSKEVPSARPADLYFERIDAYLERGTLARKCLLELLVDYEGDDIAPWAARLIGHGLMERKRIRFAEPLEPSDRIMLNAAIRGLCALVDGTVPMRVAA